MCTQATTRAGNIVYTCSVLFPETLNSAAMSLIRKVRLTQVIQVLKISTDGVTKISEYSIPIELVCLCFYCSRDSTFRLNEQVLQFVEWELPDHFTQRLGQ